MACSIESADNHREMAELFITNNKRKSGEINKVVKLAVQHFPESEIRLIFGKLRILVREEDADKVIQIVSSTRRASKQRERYSIIRRRNDPVLVSFGEVLHNGFLSKQANSYTPMLPIASSTPIRQVSIKKEPMEIDDFGVTLSPVVRTILPSESEVNQRMEAAGGRGLSVRNTNVPVQRYRFEAYATKSAIDRAPSGRPKSTRARG